MSHPAQQSFVGSLKIRFPEAFTRSRVVEIGSLNINGSVRQFFENPVCYIGVDLAAGRDVDVVCEGQRYAGETGAFDCAISTECFEHNPEWVATFWNMWRMLKSRGLFVLTCATAGRKEHGTARTTPQDSPFTVARGWDYHNLTEGDFRRIADFNCLFESFAFDVRTSPADLFFWGVKR